MTTVDIHVYPELYSIKELESEIERIRGVVRDRPNMIDPQWAQTAINRLSHSIIRHRRDMTGGASVVVAVDTHAGSADVSYVRRRVLSIMGALKQVQDMTDDRLSLHESTLEAMEEAAWDMLDPLNPLNEGGG